MALGFGFRCGFLGLLHLEIVDERLEREYGLSLLTTAPSVEYHVLTTGNDEVIVDNPARPPGPVENRGHFASRGRRSTSSRRAATSAR